MKADKLENLTTTRSPVIRLCPKSIVGNTCEKMDPSSAWSKDWRNDGLDGESSENKNNNETARAYQKIDRGDAG